MLTKEDIERAEKEILPEAKRAIERIGELAKKNNYSEQWCLKELCWQLQSVAGDTTRWGMWKYLSSEWSAGMEGNE